MTRTDAPQKLWPLAVALYGAEVLALGVFALPVGAAAGVAVTDCTRQGRELVCASPWQAPVSVLPAIALLVTVAIAANVILARRGRIRPVVVAAIATPAVQAVIVFAVLAAVWISGSAQAASG